VKQNAKLQDLTPKVRKIQTADADHISLKIPKAFMKRSLEIIIMPIDDIKTPSGGGAQWPKDFFSKTSGCFADTPLVREEQGEYELRDTIR